MDDDLTGLVRTRLAAMPRAERINFINDWLPTTPEWQEDPRWIYAIQAAESGHIKIGISRDPVKRLQQLQTSNPEQLIGLGSWPAFPGGWQEADLHDQYAECRLRGEWFEECAGMRRLIQDFNTGKHWGAALIRALRPGWRAPGVPHEGYAGGLA